MMQHGETERRRLQIQKVLDGASTQEQRNEMGQFATPLNLAIQILRYAAERTTNMERVRFLDPGIGTGAFYSALLSTVPRERIASSHGYEIQPEIAAAARRLWADEGLNVRREDFTTVRSSQPRFSVQPPDMQPALRPSPPHMRGKKTSNEAAP